MPGCSQVRPSATAPSVKACPACTPSASCSAHRHRHHVAPCPEPDACYANTRRKRDKCPSAASIVKLDGTRCQCAEAQARATRSASSLSRRRIREPKALVDSGLRRPGRGAEQGRPRARTPYRRKPFCAIL